MKRWTAPACALALTLLNTTAAWCDEPKACASLPCRTPFVRFDVVRGRLTAACNGQPQARTASATHPSGYPIEHLSVSPAGDKPAVRYQLTDDRQELTIEFTARSDVHLTREPRGESGLARVRFEQLAGQDVKLVVEADGVSRQFTAPGIWHLFMAEPAACREHLFPALQRLRSDWLFAERAESLEAALVELCQSGAIDKRRRCAALVDQLGSGSYQIRQEADRELRGMGQIVIAFLSRLDPTRLDAEQRQRVRRIADDLAICSGDTPERTAAWMLDDQAVWLTLLAHEKPEYRHVAAVQLARICDRPIEFDPAAAEIERRAQIERLRQRLVKGL